MSRMHSFGLVVLACVMSRVGHADPLAVRTIGALPFSSIELESALALRTQLATATSPRRIEARVTADGREILIELPERHRRVVLDGAHGDDAARLVAFAILDLAGDHLDPPAAAAAADVAVKPARPAVATLAETAPAEPRDAAPADRPHAARTGGALVAWGMAGSRTAAALELAITIRSPLRAIASAGGGLATTSSTTAGELVRRAFPARLGVGWQLGPIELRAHALAMIERASAARTATTAVFGGGAAVVYVAPRTIAGFEILVGAGADATSREIDYRIHDTSIATTPRISWWAGLGIGRSVWR